MYVWKSCQTFTLDKKALYLLFCSWFAPQRGGICYFTRFGGLRFCFFSAEHKFFTNLKMHSRFGTKLLNQRRSFLVFCGIVQMFVYLQSCLLSIQVVFNVCFQISWLNSGNKMISLDLFLVLFLLLWRWVSTKFHGMSIFAQNRRAKRRIGNFIITTKSLWLFLICYSTPSKLERDASPTSKARMLARTSRSSESPMIARTLIEWESRSELEKGGLTHVWPCCLFILACADMVHMKEVVLSTRACSLASTFFNKDLSIKVTL